jgi:carbon monoxide dehydrogenase subunit G
MDFKGQYRIPATPDAVWVALHNPEVLAAAIPGCEKVEKLSETEFKAKAVIKIGPVKAAFEGRVTLVPAPAPEGFTHAVMLKGEGQGGPAGFARGESQVRLARDGDGTVLDYDAKAAVGGRLAQIGQRLIDGTAKLCWKARRPRRPKRKPLLHPLRTKPGSRRRFGLPA